jgi:sugar phosphate isomerase/epimerase
MNQLLSLNQNTCKNLFLVDFIKYSKNFEGVELNFKSIQKHLSEDGNLKDILEVLEIFDTKLTSIFCLKDFSLSSEREFKTQVIPILNQMIKFCYKLEGDLIILNPSFLEPSQNIESIPQWRIFNRTTKRLEEISKKSENEDIKIGFEFITLPNSSIKTLFEAKEVLKPLESQENVGYIIDTFYFALSNSELNQLNDIKELLFLIQLSDLKYESSSDLTSLNESDRLFPGEGNFNLKNFIKFTKRIGYRKSYSIELKQRECSNNLYKKFYKKF